MELDAVSQEFIADTAPYIAGLEQAIAVAHDFVEANLEAAASVDALSSAINDLPLERTIRINVETTGAAGAVAAASAAGAGSAAAAAPETSTAGLAAESAAAADDAKNQFLLAMAERMRASTAREAAAAAAAAAAADTSAAASAKEAATGFQVAAGDGRNYSESIAEMIAAVNASTGAHERLFAVDSEGITTMQGLGEAVDAVARAQAAESALANTAASDAEMRTASTLTSINATLALARASGLTADAERLLAGTGEEAGSSVARTAAAARRGGSALGFYAGGLRLTGNALHWLVAGGAEVAAVIIPATAAFASFAAVAYPSATQVYDRMTALYDATHATQSMLGVTTTQALGLGNSFYRLSEAVRPRIFTMFGEGLNIARASMGRFGSTSMQVAGMLDEFGARVAVDLQGAMGRQLQQIVSAGVTDLRELGQVFGNLGHAVLNLAADMPGLAEVLLRIVDAASQLILWVTKIPAPILITVMAMEEFVRWGGMLVNIAGRAATAIAGLGFVTGGAETALKNFGGAVTGAENSTMKWGNSLRFFTRNPFGWAALAAAGIAALGIWLDKAASSGSNLVNAEQKLITQADQLKVLNVVAEAMQRETVMMNQMSVAFTHAGAGMQGVVVALQSGAVTGGSALTQLALRSRGVTESMDEGRNVLGQYAGVIGNVASDVIHLWASFTGATNAEKSVEALSAGQEKLREQDSNVIQGAMQISRTYGTTFVQSLAMAQAAGVNLTKGYTGQSQAALIAQMQVKSLADSYRAMGQTGSLLGNDMNVLTIQTGLQDSKVQQLNQAWDQFLQLSTNLTGGFASLQTDLQQMGKIVDTTSAKFSTFAGSAKLNTAQIAQALTSFQGNSAQVWQNFNAGVSQAETYIDALRTASAAGVVSQGQFREAVASVVGQLLPYAAKSRAALGELQILAQEANGPATGGFKALQQWVGQYGVSAGKAGDLTQTLAAKLSNVTQVAQNFAATIQSNVINALAAETVKVSGVTQDWNNYLSAMAKYGAGSAQAESALRTFTGAMQNYGFTQKDVNQVVHEATTALKGNSDTINAGRGARQNLITDISQIKNLLPSATSDLNGYTAAVRNNGATSNAAQGAREKLISDLERAGYSAQVAAGIINNQLTPSIRNIPLSKTAMITIQGSGQFSISSPSGNVAGSHHAYGAGAAGGGYITGPGSKTSDSIPKWLSHGEYVVKASSVDKYGKHLFDALNAGHMYAGGWVNASASGVNAGFSAAEKLGFGGLFNQYMPRNEGLWANSNITGDRNSSYPATVWAIEQATAQAGKQFMQQMMAGIGLGGVANSSAYAALMSAAAKIGWTGSLWNDLVAVEMREAGFNPRIVNSSSGAAGMAQFIQGWGEYYTYGGNPYSPAGQAVAMINYIACVPLSGRILTRDGWKTHDQVKPGDETVGYNPSSGQSAWTKVIAVHHYDSAPVTRLSSNRVDLRSTPNHRWLTEKNIQTGKGTYRREELTQTQHIGSRHRIRLAAPNGDIDGLPVSLAEAELLGWIAADGHIGYPARNSVNASVFQSESKPKQLAALRVLLEGVPHSEYTRPPVDGRAPIHQFRLRSPYVRDLFNRSGYERDLELMVLGMSGTQRTAFIAGLLEADGHMDQRGTWTFCQNDGPVLRAFVLAAYMAGHWCNVTGSGDQKHVVLHSPFVGSGSGFHREELELQPVWCVTTELGSWTVEQSGQVFLTGNSRYGSPAAALGHEMAYGWYDQGGYLPPGLTLAYNGTGRPEPVGGHGGVVEVHSHLYLDGEQIYEAVQQQDLMYGTRNAGARTGTMVPGRG